MTNLNAADLTAALDLLAAQIRAAACRRASRPVDPGPSPWSPQSATCADAR